MLLSFVQNRHTTDRLPRSYHWGPVVRKSLDGAAEDLTTLAEAQENVIDIRSLVVVFHQILGAGHQCYENESKISSGN